ncbi:hypothetical protein ABMA27_012533 [Loxostege sticticalis]|uniref:Uncharacterized protein n=1 Tax=Loxostege sticticalis TaxID=481309 RepID=A0ABR3GYX7_LOXSC
MYPWSCCRTCLSSQSLKPIFPEFGSAEKYSDTLFATTGLLVDPNDYLPQQMCSTCIDFINKAKEFRKKAIESHKELLKRLNSCMNGSKNIVLNGTETILNTNEDIKLETCTFLVNEKDENDRFSDDDDDITLDHFKSVDNSETDPVINSNPKEITRKLNGQSKSNDLQVSNEVRNKKKEQKEKKTVKRKPRVKKKETEDKSKEEKGRVKETIECEICHKILTSKLSIRNHYKIHTGFDVVCEHCGKKFITRRLLMQHCRAKHGYEKTDKCSYCNYRASNAEQVKIHERLHTGEKPFKCADCDGAFHRRSTYKQHIATHVKEKTVQCTECPKRFASLTLMHIHRYRHRPPSHTFRCDLCGKSFVRRRNVARHVVLSHRADPATSIQRVKSNCSVSV